MKAWMIALSIAAIFIIGGVFVAASIDKPVETTKTTSTTCSSGAGCPYGGCTATNNCGLETCGAKTGGSCGCGK